MATKTKTAKTKSLNESLVNATTATIKATVEHGEKWQNLGKKLIKKSEPIRKKQMDMVFDTANAVKTQVNTGKEKMMDLVGYDQAVAYAKNHPVGKKVVEVTDTIKTKVNENPVVKKVGETTESFRNKSTDKFNDMKEDVLVQAQKILSKGEKIVEDALKAQKEEKKPAAKTATAKKAPVAKKAASTKKKATPKEAPAAKKATAPAAPVATAEKAEEKK